MTTDVAVVIPWRGGDPDRERALRWVIDNYLARHPEWPVALGLCDDGPFNRSQAILDGARQVDAEVLVVADGDVWCDDIAEAVAETRNVGWAIPHLLIHRLSPESTEKVLAGAEWHGLPLSDDNPQDAKPYRGNETGTLFTILADVLDEVPPDVRFQGWGSEDASHSIALRTLVGPPWRGTADLFHLWHTAQPRLNRVVGSEPSKALHRRYVQARGSRAAMRHLIDESRAA